MEQRPRQEHVLPVQTKGVFFVRLAGIHLQKGLIPGHPSLNLQKNSLKRPHPHSAWTSGSHWVATALRFACFRPSGRKITQGWEEMLTLPRPSYKQLLGGNDARTMGPGTRTPASAQLPPPSRRVRLSPCVLRCDDLGTCKVFFKQLILLNKL